MATPPPVLFRPGVASSPDDPRRGRSRASWIVIAIFAPLIAPADPLAQNFTPFLHPGLHHLFGTDELGRDVLSRVIYGARLSVPIALLLVGISALIGGTLGAIAGYIGGIADGVVMRAADLVFAFPAIILAMVTTAALGPGIRNAVIALIIVSWPSYARVVRGLVLQIGQSDYVLSARLLGSSARRALLRDVLPNVARTRARARDARSRERDPAALGALVSRPRRAAADARVGRGRGRGHAVLPGLVDRDVPGARDLHRRARVQLPRRLAARRARPAVVVVAGGATTNDGPSLGARAAGDAADAGRRRDDRRRRRLRRAGGRGVRRRRRERQREDDLRPRVASTSAGGGAGGGDGDVRGPRPDRAAAACDALGSRPRRSRWCSRIRSPPSIRCSRSGRS